MGVRYVLEGSVRKEESRLRITAQLIDTTTADHVFSERYDREMKDVFAVQDDITMKIITAMRVKLTHGEQDRMLAKGTKNLEAYLKVLESRKYRETFSRESMAKSRQAAEEAIALDPGYAIAYSAAAGAIGNETWLGVYDNPAVALSRALELAQKGIALDESLAYTHNVLGFIYLMKREYDKAISEAERALALEPSSTEALTQLGAYLFSGGRAEEAIPILEKAVSLSPIPEYRLLQNLANAYRSVGNFDKAIEINQDILKRQPKQMLPHLQLAATFMLMGKEEEARLHAAEVMKIDPKFSLERYSKNLPWKNREEVDRVIDAARKAGVK
jgi:adenylate cyclase